MTIIKQQSVTGGTSHQKNLRNYINNDEKVILRASQNMEMCPDIKQWSRVEKEIEKKGILPYKTNLRELLCVNK